MLRKNIASFLSIIVFSANLASAQWKATAIAPTEAINRVATLGSKIISGNASSLNGGGFIHLSSDEGATSKKDTNQFQYILQAEGSVMYKGGGLPGTSNGFLAKSTDSGSTWTGFPSAVIELSANNTTALGTVLCMAISGKAMMLGWSYGVARSTDDGLSWSLSNTGLTTGSAAPLGNIQKMLVIGSTVYAGASGGGMFYSRDNGATWKHATGSLAAGNITALGSAGTKVYAAAQGLGLFVTADQGATWTPVNLGGAPADNFVMSFTSAGGNLFVGTLGAVKQSGDGGVTWKSIETGLPTPGYVSALTANSKYLFAGTNTGVWKRDLADFSTGIKSKTAGIRGTHAFTIMSQGKAIVNRTGSSAATVAGSSDIAAPSETYDMTGKSIIQALPEAALPQ